MKTNNIAEEKSLYDTDFYEWAIHNANLIKEGKLDELDLDNIAEELESMGRSEKRELRNRLAVLIMHLLKWQYQSNKRSDSWVLTINTQRTRINLLLEDSPSLKYKINIVIEKAYEQAKQDFEDETGIDKDILPATCPYTFKQVMDRKFRQGE
ncbi:MAG: DUF29 domain-containing protein [Candidatus Magnetoovum sp. WYHC-5]|nr:DUF29 domain-containing protein [Candidatus Magnetoovum sp. WYHC-5]